MFFFSIQKVLISTFPVTFFKHEHQLLRSILGVCLFPLNPLKNSACLNNGGMYLSLLSLISLTVSTGQGRAAVTMTIPSLCTQISINQTFRRECSCLSPSHCHRRNA